MTGFTHQREMRGLSVGIRVLSAVLVALVVHALINGLSIEAGLAAAAIALLLLGYVVVWRQGRRL
jgi:hypothetical protein